MAEFEVRVLIDGQVVPYPCHAVADGDPESGRQLLAAMLRLYAVAVDAGSVKLPTEPSHSCQPEGDPAHLPSATRWTCPEDGSEWHSVKRMIGRKMYGEWRRW